jgi:hypothetical protein
MSQLINTLKGSAAVNCVTSEGGAETEGSGLQVDGSMRSDYRRRRRRRRRRKAVDLTETLLSVCRIRER